jgi:RND family efflux transporter MFP subunit
MRCVATLVLALLLVEAVLLAPPCAAASARAGRFGVTLRTQPSPPVVGANQLLVRVTVEDRPASGVGVNLHLDMVGMSMPSDLAARPTATAGEYAASVNLAMAGRWKVTVQVQQMPGMPMAGDGEASFQVATGQGVTAGGGTGGRWWALLGLLLVGGAAALFVRFRPRLRPTHLGVVAGLLILLIVLLITVAVVRKYRNPTVSTVLGSARMNMEAMKPPTSAVPVTTEVVRPVPFQAAATYTGTVVPDLEEDIYPRVMGRLSYMPFYPGQVVQAGEVVARLEARELEASSRGAAGGTRAAEGDQQAAYQSAEEADSAVGAARAGVKQAEGDVTTAEADVAYWDNEIAREQHLYEVGAISKEELDRETSQATASKAKLAQARAGVQRARQEVKQAQARRAGAQAAIASAQARVAQAQAMQAGAATMRSYTELRASYGGLVTARNVAPGVVVQPGTSILTIAKTDYVRLQVNVAETDLAAVRVGQRLIARATDGGRSLSAPITDIFPAQDPTSRTAVVEARVRNPDGHLKPGQYLSVQLPLGAGAPAALSVPNAALLERAEGMSVFRVQHDTAGTTAQRVRLLTGRASNARTEVLSGLRPGDEVIVSGAAGLNGGEAVTVAPPSSETQTTP